MQIQKQSYFSCKGMENLPETMAISLRKWQNKIMQSMLLTSVDMV